MGVSGFSFFLGLSSLSLLVDIPAEMYPRHVSAWTTETATLRVALGISTLLPLLYKRP